jgi:hypothetical protein
MPIRLKADPGDSLRWEALFLTLCLALVAVGAVVLFPGCKSAGIESLAVLTRTAAATQDAKLPELRAELDLCATLVPVENEEACVERIEAEWAPARAAVDGLLALDKAALDSEADLEHAVRLYCRLSEAWPELPKLDAIVPGFGVCP